MTVVSRHPAVVAFLDDADVSQTFTEGVLARIEAHDETLDRSYLWSSIAGLVRELGEEPLDTAAWAALIAARLEHDGTGANSTSARARALLSATTQRVAEADVLVGELRRLLLGRDTAA